MHIRFDKIDEFIRVYDGIRYLVLLDPRQELEGSYKIGSVCPSILPSILLSFRLSGSFLGIGPLVFSETQDGVRGSCLVVHDRAGFFKKSLFTPRMGKMSQKQGFLNLLENLAINFFWIWSIKKFYNICCILTQIPYLGKIWFLRYGPKCSRPIRLQYF